MKCKKRYYHEGDGIIREVKPCHMCIFKKILGWVSVVLASLIAIPIFLLLILFNTFLLFIGCHTGIIGFLFAACLIIAYWGLFCDCKSKHIS